MRDHNRQRKTANSLGMHTMIFPSFFLLYFVYFFFNPIFAVLPSLSFMQPFQGHSITLADNNDDDDDDDIVCI